MVLWTGSNTQKDDISPGFRGPSPAAYSRKCLRGRKRGRDRTRPKAPLGRNLFVREAGHVGSLAGVLNSNPTDVAMLIDVQNSVLVQVLRLSDIGCPQFDIESIGILEILNLHGLKDRSKKALCTVSLSGSSITRKYLPSISAIRAQRRMRPSC